ncbi:monooxygenase [Pediococcus pentosaceus]|nr:monooxygenase [Pediococcus pentosaceus]MCT3022328.1 monooxygenase [Pediococcus pentosaceus]QQC01726.1 monooxygenase [Pediococcus pentosaceus]
MDGGAYVMKNLNVSFGSEPVLREIKEKYASRKMTLLSNSAKETSFQLVDFSDQKNVFYSLNRYRVLFESPFLNMGDIFIYDFFDLAGDSLSAFDEKVRHWSGINADSSFLQSVLLLSPLDGKPHNRAVLTIWSTNKSDQVTLDTHDLKKTLEPYVNHNYFRTTYKVLL